MDGARFQSYPSSHALPPESGPHIINIVGTPTQRGTLKIMGTYWFKMSYLVRSQCYIFAHCSNSPSRSHSQSLSNLLSALLSSTILENIPTKVMQAPSGHFRTIETNSETKFYCERELNLKCKFCNVFFGCFV